MRISWTPALATGVDSIDSQHKELFRLVGELLDAMKRGQAREELAPALQFLGRYVVAHFADEEKRMQASGYPEMQQHVAEHNRLVQDLEAIRQELSQSGATSALAIRVQKKLAEWLVNHIAERDVKLGDYLRKAKAA